jgi:hypothetical protein
VARALVRAASRFVSTLAVVQLPHLKENAPPLRSNNNQISGRKIVARCQQWLTKRYCQGVHGTIPEVDLGPVTHYLSKAPKRCNPQPCLHAIKWDNLAPNSSISR